MRSPREVRHGLIRADCGLLTREWLLGAGAHMSTKAMGRNVKKGDKLIQRITSNLKLLENSPASHPTLMIECLHIHRSDFTRKLKSDRMVSHDEVHPWSSSVSM